MRASLIVTLVGCGAATHTPVAAPPQAVAITPFVEPVYAERTMPVPAKAATKDRYGTRDLFEPVIRGREQIAMEAGWRSSEPQVVDTAELDFLGRCARDYILTQPESARRTLMGAFAHYVTGCDVETGKLVLERPLGFDNRDRRTTSDAVFIGGLSPRGSELVLKITSCGSETMFERITISGSGHTWTSPRLEVRRGFDGCDVAELPYTSRLANVILSATERGATISLVGTETQVAIDGGMRDELRGVIDAVDAITAP